MQGDMVGRGFAIEIEDRGLGISAARIEEINANLASPPQFDLSGSDRLGLFIAGQLARRHDIKVTLRASVYGGTTAIVLIPLELVVPEQAIGVGPPLPAGEEDGSRSDRSGGRHAALTAISASNGHSSRADADYPSPAGTPERSLSGAGFSFGRLTPQDASSDDHGPAPTQPLVLATPLGDGDGADREAPAAGPAELGLPVRVRQASLAPQLRDTTTEEPGVSGGFSLPRRRTQAAQPLAELPADTDATAAAVVPSSPEAARDIVSALQRGWQLGRSEVRLESIEETTKQPEPDGADEADRHED
jgi:hypothetical protein